MASFGLFLVSYRVSPAMAAGCGQMEDVVAPVDEQAERRAPKLADRLVG